MIVASIPITFKSGRAADLLGHMTETGREYEFIPDITLPEGCSAAIEIVKPDGMFVISECSIVEGNIIVTLPAQALAVRGMAHYIIRITTADDKIIFSAAGSIWVDDALITNELLESISEVYGLTFPDDFLTTADLADYVTIDQLRAALNDYALKTDIIDVVANPSGAAAADLTKIKIGSEIYKIPEIIGYSETLLWENAAGAHGILSLSDNMSNYDAVFFVMAQPNEPAYRSSQIIPVSAIDTSGGSHFGIFVSGSTNYCSSLTYVDDTHISFDSWSSSYPMNCYKIVGVKYGRIREV